jgi:hypothetical protein
MCTTLAGAVGCSIGPIPARDLMTEVRRHDEVAIRERVPLAHKAGKLPKWLNVDNYTRYTSLCRSLAYPSKRRMDRPERNLDRTSQMALRRLGY